MQALQSLNLQGCRNIISTPGKALPLLQRLTALTSLVLRNCDGLQDGALATTALASLHHLDLSGESWELSDSGNCRSKLSGGKIVTFKT